MLRVGVTGGIGSGKSTVSRVFARLGVPVYDTDSRAKELMNADPGLMRRLRSLLGEETYSEEGLDRRYVASRIFNDFELIREVNATVHPVVADDFKRWAEEREAQGHPYVVMECAILFESGFDSLVDFAVTVSAPLEERITRASSRDEAEREEIRRRIAHQMDDAERESRADFVIHNGDRDMVLAGVLELHEKFKC